MGYNVVEQLHAQGARMVITDIDPAKVARLALQNAASVAALLITTDAVVTEKPKKKERPHPYPGGAEDMY